MLCRLLSCWSLAAKEAPSRSFTLSAPAISRSSSARVAASSAVSFTTACTHACFVAQGLKFMNIEVSATHQFQSFG